jgi:hypothetical protein
VEMVSGVIQGIEDQGENARSYDGSKQDGSGAKRLAPGEIEAGSGESGDSAGRGRLHGALVLGCSGGRGRVGHHW